MLEETTRLHPLDKGFLSLPECQDSEEGLLVEFYIQPPGEWRTCAVALVFQRRFLARCWRCRRQVSSSARGICILTVSLLRDSQAL